MHARASLVLGFMVGCVATSLAVLSTHALAEPAPLVPHKPIADVDPVVHAVIASLDRRLTALEQHKSAVFVGITAATTGKFQHRAAPTGLAAAAALCTDIYGPGARMCTAQELYASSAGGILSANKSVPKSWIYMPTWGTTPLADNCGGYTDATTDRKTTGTAFQWDLLPNGHHGPRFLGGTDAACNSSLPIACCQ